MQKSTGVLTTRGRGSWKEGQEFSELRRPHATPTVLGSPYTHAVPDPKAGSDCTNVAFAQKVPDISVGDDCVKNSRLSADAKEFFPKDYVAEKSEAAGVDAAISQNLTDSYLSQIISDLNFNPGLYDNCIGTLTDLLLHDSEIPDAYQKIVNTIVEKCITLPNFRYTGTRLLCHFRSSLPDNLQHDFRNCLLKKCQDENEGIVLNNKIDFQRVQGFALFLAELFIQMDVSVGTDDRIKVLGSALCNVIVILLNPATFENTKCVCQILKLTGLALDMQDTHIMGVVFETLFRIQQSTTDTNMRRLISSVMSLRQNAWRESVETVQHTHSEYLEGRTAHTFYLQDGEVLSPEESRFLEENAMLPSEESEYSDKSSGTWYPMESEEEEEEGFDEAYEKFLEFSNQNKKSS